MLHTGTKRLERSGDAGEMLLTLAVAAELLFLSGERLGALFEVAAAPLIFIEWDDGSEISVGEPLDLLMEMRLPTAQCLAARQELLGKPGAAVRSRHRGGERLGFAQERTKVRPDKGVELVGWGIARWTAGGAMRVGAVSLAIA